MKSLLLLAILVPGTVNAGIGDYVDGYVDLGVIGAYTRGEHRRTFLHATTGLEVRAGWLGLVGELGGVTATEDARQESGGSTTVALAFHPVDRASKFDPYVMGGWSAAFRTGGIGAWTVGAGVAWRPTGKRTLRVSVVDYRRWGVHLYEFRLGMGVF